MSQFYFAWVDESENEFNDTHKREDEFIFDFNLSQSEGDFATLDITIINPRVGLLAPGRKLWAWLAYEDDVNGVVPLFFGRIVAVPDDLQKNEVKLTFIARPSDFDAQKVALAETMKVRPFWDPIWFSPETVNDPDNVLESRPELWHTDRVTHEVTSSNIIEGEDGNIELGTDDVFYDSVSIHYGAPPLHSVSMDASVSWDQKAAGTLNITQQVLRVFQAANSGTGFLIESYTGEGLKSSWPEAGKSIGGGWNVSASFCNPIFYQSDFTVFEPGHAIPPMDRANGLPFEYFEFDGTFQPHGGLVFPKWVMSCQLVLGYNVSRQRSERLSFVLNSDTQAIVTDPAGQDVVALTMSSSEITQPIDPGGLMPLRDLRARSYFSTDRGVQSIEYLLAIARARLLSRARCVYVDLDIPFALGIASAVSCRKNVVFTDARLPGGIATGKIMSYSFTLNGDTGETNCTLSFGCTVGHGNTVEAVDGSPDYVEDAYVEEPYQTHSGGFILPDLGDVLYAPILGAVPNDDGINFFSLAAASVIQSLTVANGAASQAALFPLHGPVSLSQPLGTWSQYYLVNLSGQPSGSFRPEYDPAAALDALNNSKTTVDLKLKSLQGGPFETDYDLDVSDLMVPKLIDLEASSS